MKALKQSEIFFRAAELIMERGLAKCSYGSNDGPVCLLGATIAAHTRLDELNITSALEQPAIDYAPPFDRDRYFCVADWNDDPSTTPDEVVQVLQFMALSEKDAGR